MLFIHIVVNRFGISMIKWLMSQLTQLNNNLFIDINVVMDRFSDDICKYVIENDLKHVLSFLLYAVEWFPKKNEELNLLESMFIHSSIECIDLYLKWFVECGDKHFYEGQIILAANCTPKSCCHCKKKDYL